MSSLSLRRNTLTYGAAIAMERLISFFTLPILTKSLPIELFAVWSQVITVAGLLTGLVLVQFATAYINFYTGSQDDEKWTAYHAILRVVLVNCFAAVVIALLFGDILSLVIFGSRNYSIYTVLTAFFLSTEAMFQMTTGYLRAEHRIGHVSFYYLAKYVGRLVILFWVVMAAGDTLERAILLVCLWQLAINLVIYFREIPGRPLKLVTSRLDRGTWRTLWRFSLPLVPLGVVIWAGLFLDRFLLIHYLGLDAVAPYATAWALVSAVAMIGSILGYTLYPVLAQLWNAGARDRAGQRMVDAATFILFLGIPAVIGTAVISDPLIAIFATEAYQLGAAVYLLLGGAILCFALYEMVVFVIILEKKSTDVLAYTVVAAAANLVLNLLLIPIAGVAGAAAAKLITNGFLLAATWRRMLRITPVVFPWRGAARFLVTGAMMGGGLILIDTLVEFSNLTKLLVFVLAGGSFYVLVDWIWPASVLRRATGIRAKA